MPVARHDRDVASAVMPSCNSGQESGNTTSEHDNGDIVDPTTAPDCSSTLANSVNCARKRLNESRHLIRNPFGDAIERACGNNHPF
jgi:hypothetical protein